MLAARMELGFGGVFRLYLGCGEGETYGREDQGADLHLEADGVPRVSVHDDAADISNGLSSGTEH